MLAYSRPFWPLFLHVFGAMTLYGTIITALLLAWTKRAAATFTTLLIAIPCYVVFRVFAQVIYSDEDFAKDPTWIGIGFMASDFGLLLLLLSLGIAFWWKRSGRPVAGRTVAGLSAVYLVLLTVAMLAMSGKWG
jgi:undecaprenyl pyrophosphate phosphatase UppP